MKKKKKQLQKNLTQNKKRNIHKEINILLKFKNEKIKNFFIVIILSFIIGTAITTSQKPMNTHPTGGDADYYFQNAKLFSKVWKAPFYYFPGLLFNTLSHQELLSIGFNHQSDFNSFFRAPGYITFLSLWQTIFGESELASLISQVFLLSILFGFIYLTLRIFTNNLFSYIGVFLALIYLTFYTNAVQTMTEIFQALMILAYFDLLYYIMIKLQKNRKLHFIILGAFLVSIPYAKMSLKFLYIPLVIIIIYYIFIKFRANKKLFKTYGLTFLISFFVIFIFLNTMLSRGSENGKNANLGGWRNYWAGSCLLSDGFGINTGHHEKEFRNNLNKSTKKFWFNRYSEICKYAVIDTFINHPLQFISMTLKKIGLLLFYPPQNDESLNLLKKLRHLFIIKYHIFLLIMSIIIFLFVSEEENSNNKLFIFKSYYFVILLYLALLYGLSNPGTRYFLPLIPFYIILTTFSLYIFIKNKLYKNKKILYPLLTIPLILLFINTNTLNNIFHNITLIRIFRDLLYILSIVSVIKILSFNLKNKNLEENILSFFALIFIVITSSVFIFDSKYDNHFSISNKNIKIKQTILINNFNQEKYEKAFIVIDVSTKYSNATLNVNFNNNFSTNILVSKARTFFSTNYPLPDNKILYKPHWIFVEIPTTSIKTSNLISIKARNASIYYSYTEQKRRIPSFFYYKPNVNDIVFGPFSAMDERCYPITKIKSKNRKTFIENREKKYDAHIFLFTKEKGDYYFPAKYEKFNDTNLKYIALVNPVDRKLVFWSKSNPGEQFMKIKNNLYLYIAGELDRFYKGYTLY